MNAKRYGKSVAAFGELVFDHVFQTGRDTECKYVLSRGGGSLWNMLANLVQHGVKPIAMGSGGDDEFGRSVVTELGELGIDTSLIELRPRKRTRLIFETLYAANDGSTMPIHKFTDVCTICRRRLRPHWRATTNMISEAIISAAKAASILCVDRTTTDVLTVLQHARASGTRFLLELGRVSSLRYTPAVQIASSLAAFDIVVMPCDVAKSIQQRARLSNIAELIRPGGRLALICVTEAQNGVTAHVRSSNESTAEIHVDGRMVPHYVDTAGAGDMFSARVISWLLNKRIMSRGPEAWVPDPGGIEAALEYGVHGALQTLVTLGARGHLPTPTPSAQWYGVKRWGGYALEKLQAKSLHHSVCPFCLFPATATRRRKATGIRRSQSRANVTTLLQKTLFTAEKAAAIATCARVFRSIEGQAACVIGTGGSYSAAVFIASVMGKQCGIVAQALRPYDYIRIGCPVQALIVVSHSGSTHDCVVAIRSALDNGVKKIVLITGSISPKLPDLFPGHIDTISYGWRHTERGFVSIAGTVCPCALVVAATSSPPQIISMAEEVEASARGGDFIATVTKWVGEKGGGGQVDIEVIGGGWAWPAMIDVESKFTEGGLGCVRLHESKDFSHGRFISLLTEAAVKRPRLLISTGKLGRYEKRLASTLGHDGLLLHLSSTNEGMYGGLSNMVAVQHLVQCVAEIKGMDISRPPDIPNRGLALYRWRSLE